MSDTIGDAPAGYADRDDFKANDSAPYLADITFALKEFDDWQKRATEIDKLYASLKYQGDVNRDREFAMFWANTQVLAPSIYSRPPIAIATPRWKARKGVLRSAAEVLERDLALVFEAEDIDGVMRQVRDDLAIVGRGAAWLRYDPEGGQYKQVCIEHVDRRDFLHQPARKWKEVQWVARRAWLTKEQAEERFTVEKAAKLSYSINKEDKESGATDQHGQAEIWEIWHKAEDKVIWVSEGSDIVLDKGPPHLKLEGFFPCPRPAYSTTQRQSLVPVPDYSMYQDQLNEINDLTKRIASLQSALKVRAFYPAGAGELGDAIEAAIKATSDQAIMIPVSNWAVMGTNAAADTIVWLPLDQISKVITECVALRRQYIEDVYQITGLSDIMRGSTDPNETLGAQQLKSQYGSIRVRDRQNELVRVAKEIAVIAAEILAENCPAKELLTMSQLELRTDKQVKEEIAKIEAEAKQAMQAQVQQQIAAAQQNPEQMQQLQANPQMVQQMLDQLIEQTEKQIKPKIDKLNEEATQEKVIALLRDEKIRPFALDIETDSTIQPDEDAEKQRRSEVVAAIGGLMREMVPMVQQGGSPELAKFGGVFIKYAMGAFRPDRELDQAMDELIDGMQLAAEQPKQDPNAAAQQQAQAEMQLRQQEMQGKMQIEQAKLQADQGEAQAKQQAEAQKAQMEAQDAEAERAFKAQEMQMKAQEMQAKMQHEREMMEMEKEIKLLEMEAVREKNRMQAETMQMQVAAKSQEAQIDAAAQERDMQFQAEQQDRQAEQSEYQFQQKAALQAMKPVGGENG